MLDSMESRADASAAERAVRRSCPGLAAETIELEWREWRWISVLSDRVALVANDETGWRRLKSEAKISRRLNDGRRALVPEIIDAFDEERVQLRRRVKGPSGHELEGRIFGVVPHERWPAEARYRKNSPLTAWGRSFASELGEALASFHASFEPSESQPLGIARFAWDWRAIHTVLRSREGLDDLRRMAANAQSWCASRRDAHCEVVLHGDLHMGNVVASAGAESVMFLDLEDVAVGDPHLDFRFLHSNGGRFACAVLEAYRRRSGRFIDEDTVGRLHVCTALQHFAWYSETHPRFPELVCWARAAAGSLAPDWLR